MKKVIIKIILVLVILFLIVLGYLYIKNDYKVAVLGYHSIIPRKLNTSNDNLAVDSEQFEKELKYLKKMGYKTMSLDEFYCWKTKKCKKKHNSVLITFDDGYNNNYDYAFDILKKYNMKAVVFCVGAFIESNDKIHMNKDKINQIKDKYPNIEIASHSYNMHYHSEKTYEEVNNDIREMKKIVNSKYYAYPYGDLNKEYIRALKDNDYEMAFTFGPKREHRKADLKDNDYTIPRLNISKDMPFYKYMLRLLLPM